MTMVRQPATSVRGASRLVYVLHVKSSVQMNRYRNTTPCGVISSPKPTCEAQSHGRPPTDRKDETIGDGS
jgi:hypothetical protein